MPTAAPPVPAPYVASSEGARAWTAPSSGYSWVALTGFVLSLVPFMVLPSTIFCVVALAHQQHRDRKGRGLVIAGLVIDGLVIAGLVIDGLFFVLIVVAVLAAIAIPTYLDQRQRVLLAP